MYAVVEWAIKITFISVVAVIMSCGTWGTLGLGAAMLFFKKARTKRSKILLLVFGICTAITAALVILSEIYLTDKPWG